MKRTMLAVALALACSSDPPAPNQTTVNDFCNQVGDRRCKRIVACRPGAISYDECFVNWKKGCCLDKSRCNEMVPTAVVDDYVRTCGGAIDSQACADVGALPAACVQ